MKCIYAIPRDREDEAQALCDAYGNALETLAPNSLTLADDLRDFVESLGTPVMKLDEEDWTASRRGLEDHGEHDLAGAIFWTCDAVRRVLGTLDKLPDSASPARGFASWLAAQSRRERAAVLLTR